MKLSQHALFWGAALAIFIGLLALFSDVLTPFVLGIAVAYFLNPVVNLLGKYKLSRTWATAVILVLFLTIICIISMLIGPLLGREIIGFVNALPGYVEALQTNLAPYIERFSHYLGGFKADDLFSSAQENSDTILAVLKNLGNRLLSGGSAVIGLISLLILMPVVAFYMMRDWPKFASSIDDLWPRQHRETIRELLKEIDYTISAFVRGQLLVAFILGLFYGSALTLMGLEYGFFVGFTAGMLGIIPYLGSILGLLASTVLAWLQFHDLSMVGLALGIFVFGQAVEGNVLTPKLVGDKVGLHALWVIFALIAGGNLLGFTGLLIAVPFAAVVGVLLRFALKQYKQSAYYK